MSQPRRLVDIRPGEMRALLLAAGYFFFVLSSYYIIRPIRDEMGVAGGVENLPWLFTGTLLATILVQPLFASLVRKFPARVFIPITYNFFALNLVVFWALLRSLPDTHDIWIGRAFFIWISVYNMFIVSIFWAFMVDIFETEQSKRLFGAIGVGGTLGAILGGVITATFVGVVGQTNLLLVSALLLEVAVVFVVVLARWYATNRPLAVDQPVGGGIFAGITHVASSPYLLMICLYMLLFTVTSTFLYFHQAEIASSHFPTREARTAFFAKVDITVNVLTLVTQAFVTAHLLRRLGVAMTLAILPIVSIIGFAGIGIVPTLAMVVAIQVIRRAGNFAIARPTREILFTVVRREDKYKAKTFVDTTVYRFGDQVGSWAQPALAAIGIATIASVAWTAVPLSAVWLAVSIWLGRRQKEMQDSGATTADRVMANR